MDNPWSVPSATVPRRPSTSLRSCFRSRNQGSECFEPEIDSEGLMSRPRKVQDSNEDDAELEKEDTGDAPRMCALESAIQQALWPFEASSLRETSALQLTREHGSQTS